MRELEQLRGRLVGLYDPDLRMCSVRAKDRATHRVPRVIRAVDITDECPWDPNYLRVCILYALYSDGLVASIQIHFKDDGSVGTQIPVGELGQHIRSLDYRLPGEIHFADELDLTRKSNFSYIHLFGDGSSYFEELAERLGLPPINLAEIVRNFAPV